LRLLVSLLLLVAITACGASSTDGAPSADRATDVAFVTELMHRDAALLNLLDVGLGRRLDPAVVAATDQLRRDASIRIERSADQLDEWGEKVPRTVRDHGFEHSSDAHDIPSLAGMPTGEDLQALGRVHGAGFGAAFVELLRSTLETNLDLAEGHHAAADAVATLAQDTARSCDSALEAL
jgi:Domain of unknown function (DUF305)